MHELKLVRGFPLVSRSDKAYKDGTTSSKVSRRLAPHSRHEGRASHYLSFPKIISGRIGGAVQPGWEWWQWRQIVGPLDAKAHLSRRIANIALNDAMILPYDANPGRM